MLNTDEMSKRASSIILRTRPGTEAAALNSITEMLDEALSEVARLQKEHAGPSVAERLTRYRCATLAGVTVHASGPAEGVASAVEDIAHAMFAAERSSDARR